MIELSEATPQLRPGEFYVQRESLKVDTSSLPTDTIYTLRPISSEPGYFYLLANGSYSHKLRYTSIFTMKDGVEHTEEFYVEDCSGEITAGVSAGVNGIMIKSGPHSFVDTFSSKGMTHVHS